MKINLQNKKVLVLGLGETGHSALRWLENHGAILSVADSRKNPPNVDDLVHKMPQVDVYTGPFNADLLLKFQLIVISPGISLQEPAVQAAMNAGIPVIGDVELFAQHQPAGTKVIGITGANGKTTVTTLVGEMCKAAGLKVVVAGNIGLPVLDALTLPKPDIYVLELSSFQLETTHTLKLDVATLLNISEDHMDRYEDMEAYIAAKARIFEYAKVRVLNRDDRVSMRFNNKDAVTFGLNEAPNKDDFGVKTCEGNLCLTSGQRKLTLAKELKIAGLHNVSNGLAALAICASIGLERTPVLSALKTFKGLPHRVEWVANIDEVDFYDDSKGTNVGATCAALAGLPQKAVLIAGGDGKDQDFSPLAAAVIANARAVVVFGRDADKIEAVLLATNLPIYDAIDLREAVAIAHKVALPGDAVLLSPACASFDMFKNYIHRAEVFIDAVHALEVAVC